jgi:hypothetical protein
LYDFPDAHGIVEPKPRINDTVPKCGLAAAIACDERTLARAYARKADGRVRADRD